LALEPVLAFVVLTVRAVAMSVARDGSGHIACTANTDSHEQCSFVALFLAAGCGGVMPHENAERGDQKFRKFKVRLA
jgi:hypothetical protein